MDEEIQQNGEHLTLQDLMFEIRQQRKEVQDLREEVHGSSESVSTEVKKLKKAKDVVWKYNGNKVQFDFNEDLNDTVSQVVWALNNNKIDYSKELCEDLQKKLKRRNKLIRLADTSSGGWETVKQYESNPIASDSDDESKINKAENRALKRKRDSSKGRTSTFRSVTGRLPSSSPAFPGSNFGASTGRGLFRGYNGISGSFNWGQGQAVGKRTVLGPCFACGEGGHIRRYCPRTQRSVGSAGIQQGGKTD